MQTISNNAETHRYRERILEYGSIVAALFIVSIYFSTFLAIVLSGVLGFLWILSGQFRNLPDVIRLHPVVAWSLLLYLAYFIGCSYGDAPRGEFVPVVKKYRELFFIPALIPFLSAEKYRKWAWLAVLTASLLSLSISYFMYFGFFKKAYIQDPSLKSRITHSIIIAYFAFYCFHRALDSLRFPWIYWVLALAAVGNLFFVVEGRTGQLILLVLGCLFAFQRFTLKGRIVTILAIAAFMSLFMLYSNKAERINEGLTNTQEFLENHPEQQVSSMGQRFSFWKHSVKLIAEKPLAGHGTGSFAREYARVAAGEQFLAEHPHNEFLFVAVQLGLMGLIPYLGFLISQLYESHRLPSREKWLLQGLLATLVLTSLFNTPIYDHTEGHWFAFMIALLLASAGSGETAVKAHA